MSAACESGDKEEAMWADVARVYAANRQLPDGSERLLEAAYATGLRSRLAPDGWLPRLQHPQRGQWEEEGGREEERGETHDGLHERAARYA